MLKEKAPCNKAQAMLHEIPIMSQTLTHVPVYTVPNEMGYFPTPGDEELVTCPNCQIYQLQNMHDQTSGCAPIPTLLSKGQLTLHDPVPGTPSEVVLIGKCNGVIFYIKEDDVTLILSPSELALICVPSLDCLYLSLPDTIEEHVQLHIQGLFAARTNLYEAGDMVRKEQIELIRRGENFHEGSFDDTTTDDNLRRVIYQSSVWIAQQILLLSEVGAKQVEDHGYRLRSSMKPIVENVKCDAEIFTKEMDNIQRCNKKLNIKPAALQRSLHIRKFSKSICSMAEQGSDSISNFVGGLIGSSITEKPDDGTTMRYARQLLRTSLLSFSEICDSVDQSVDILAGTTKREAVACVAVQYGDDAAQLCRHTLGSAVDFGKTYLTVRRVLNIKTVARATLQASSGQERLD